MGCFTGRACARVRRLSFQRPRVESLRSCVLQTAGGMAPRHHVRRKPEPYGTAVISVKLKLRRWPEAPQATARAPGSDSARGWRSRVDAAKHPRAHENAAFIRGSSERAGPGSSPKIGTAWAS